MRREADEKARREADEKLRREVEEKTLRETEDRVRREADEKARREADDHAQQESSQTALREDEAAARRDAESEREAEEAARQAEDDALRRRNVEAERLAEVQTQPTKKRRGSSSLAKPVLMGVVGVGVIGLIALHLVPFDGKRTAFEEIGGAALGAPVKIGSANFSLFPSPQWKLNELSIGSGTDAVKIHRVTVGASVSSIWQMPKELMSLQLDGARIPVTIALKLLHETSGSDALKSAAITATDLLIIGEGQEIPPMSVEAKMQDGELKTLAARGESEKMGKVTVDAQHDNKVWQINAKSEKFNVPFGADLPVKDFSLDAQLAADGLTVKQFSAGLYGGDFSGNGNIAWQAGWRVKGNLEVKTIDASRLAPGWAKDGYVKGSAQVDAQVTAANQIYPSARIDGSFSLGNGVLVGVDLDRVLQGRGLGEETRFESLEGQIRFENQRVELSGMKLKTGTMNAKGALSIAADHAVTGNIGIEVKTQSTRVAVDIGVTGTTAKPQFKR